MSDDLCKTCGGGVFPGREVTSCPDPFHGGKKFYRTKADLYDCLVSDLLCVHETLGEIIRVESAAPGCDEDEINELRLKLNVIGEHIEFARDMFEAVDVMDDFQSP